MGTTLKEFISVIRDNNISKPSMFYVEMVHYGRQVDEGGGIIPQADRSDVSRQQLDILKYLCFSANTPAFSFFTNDNYTEAGTRRKFIYDHDYGPLRLQFYCDSHYETKYFFDKWKTKILPAKRHFAYPKDYTCDKIAVYIVDHGDSNVYKYIYSNCVPKSISEIDLSWQAGTQIATFSVDFVFEECYYEKLDANTGNALVSSIPKGVLDSLLTNGSLLNRELLEQITQAKGNEFTLGTIDFNTAI